MWGGAGHHHRQGPAHADDLVTDIAPEFIGTSLDGATVQHVIDMTAGTDFIEDYDVYTDVQAAGPTPARRPSPNHR